LSSSSSLLSLSVEIIRIVDGLALVVVVGVHLDIAIIAIDRVAILLCTSLLANHGSHQQRVDLERSSGRALPHRLRRFVVDRAQQVELLRVVLADNVAIVVCLDHALSLLSQSGSLHQSQIPLSCCIWTYAQKADKVF
jgi:hypothetical protein